MRKNRIYILGNADSLLKFDATQISHNDIVVMFNIPRRHDIVPNILFVANTIHPAKKFLRSNYRHQLISQNQNLKIIFPYSSETIDFIPILEKSYKVLDKIRGWNSNGANKIVKHVKKDYQFISLSEYEALCQTLRIEPHKFIPSSGSIAVHHLINRYNLNHYEIHLTGFTFQGSPCHNFNNEKQYINHLVNNDILHFHS